MPHNELTNIKTDGALGGKARAINTQIVMLNATPMGQVKICIMLLAEALKRVMVHQALQGKEMTPRDHRLMEEACWHDFKKAMRTSMGMPSPSTDAHDALRGAAHVIENGELDPGSVSLQEGDQVHPGSLRDDDPVHPQEEEQ